MRHRASLAAQETLQMGVAMTEVKDHMEYWLTTRTSQMQKAHAESLSTMKVRELCCASRRQM
jgi:hypothetical protein